MDCLFVLTKLFFYIIFPSNKKFQLKHKMSSFNPKLLGVVEKTLIGEGNYGKVYKIKTSNGKVYAIKEGRLINLISEKENLKRLNSKPKLIRKNFYLDYSPVVHLFGHEIIKSTTNQHSTTLRLWLEYIDGQDLIHFIETNKKLNSTQYYKRVISIFWQLLDAIEYIHQKGIYHRDIKPANIMLTTENKIKLIDFGAGIITTKNTLDYIGTGTPQYIPPSFFDQKTTNKFDEYRKIGIPDFKIHDLFSLGYTLLNLLTKQENPWNMKEFSWHKPILGDIGREYKWKDTIKDLKSLYSMEILKFLEPLLVVVADLLSEALSDIEDIKKRYLEVFIYILYPNETIDINKVIKKAKEYNDVGLIRYISILNAVKYPKEPNLDTLKIVMNQYNKGHSSRASYST